MPRDIRCSRRPSWPWVTAGVLVATASAQSSLLQEAGAAVPFVGRNWNSGNGLPQNTAGAILPARDGHMWIGTFGGLVRFDGEDMEVFDTVTSPGLRGNRVTCLFEGRDGTLWIGSDHSGLASFRAGAFRAHTGEERMHILAFAEDSAGRILVATTTSLLRQDGDSFRPLHPDRLHNVRRLLRLRSGAMLAAAAEGVWSFDDGQARRLAAGNPLCLVELGDGVLVGTDKGLFRLGDGRLEPWRPIPRLERSAVFALLAAADGALWVGSSTGAIRIDPADLPEPGAEAATAPALELTDTLEVPPTRVLCEDREGGIWLGHSEFGLTRLRRAEVLGHRTESGLPSRGIVTVLGDGQGELFVGTAQGLLRSRAGRFEEIPGTAKLGSCRGMALDPDGTLWFSTRDGLARLDAGTPRLWLDTQEWPTHVVRAILREENGDHWLAGGGGLALLSGRELTVPPVAEALRDLPLRALSLAPDGALWAGGADLLARIDPQRGTLRTWHSGTDLPFGEVRAILPESGVRAWIATYGGGLVLVEEARCTAIDERHGLQDQSLCAIVPHGDELFLASNSGACLLRRADLEDVAAGRSATLACLGLLNDGPRAAECDGGLQPCATAANGKLWFCGIDGLYEFDPARLQPRQHDLPVKLEQLFLGESPWTGGLDVAVPRGVRALEVRLGTCAFDHHAATRYRWRLLGHAPGWTEPGYVRELRFADLPPGELVLEAEAVDLDGRSSRTPLRMTLAIPVLPWETGSFRVALALALAVVAGLLIRYGARGAAKRAARLQTIVDQRTSELLAAQQQLEQRVEERTRELQTAMHRQEVEQAERQRLERELQQLQRMESIGQLAGGIAHDFNNLLTVTSGAGELLESEVTSAEGAALCRSIQQACGRGRALTQHLLAVASRQLVTVERLDLDRVVAELLPVLRSLLGEDVGLRFQSAGGPTTVRAATTQIEQILLNLAANAHDAMPRGGEVVIRLACAGERVMLELEDSGEGMPADVLARAFEPFFTTKQQPGRGLGLATVYGIIKQLGGDVSADSKVGQGTRVRIALPRAPALVDEPAVEVPRPVRRRMSGTVLLIEDEPDVRAIIERMLRGLGCQVVSSGGGEQAVALLRDDPERIDAVVSDVVMSGLQGKPLVEALRSVRPDLSIVFLSGHLDGRLTHQELHEMGLEILAKPVESARLAHALERAWCARAER